MWGIARATRHPFGPDIRGSLPSLEKQWTQLSLGSQKHMRSQWGNQQESALEKHKMTRHSGTKSLHQEARARLVNNRGKTTSRILPFKANPQGKCLILLQRDLQLHPGQLHAIAAQLLRNPWANTCRGITNSSTRCADWAMSSIPAVPRPREQMTKGETEIYPRETSGHGSIPA